MLWRWYTPLGVFPFPLEPDAGPGVFNLASPLCTRQAAFFATLESAEPRWTSENSGALIASAPDVQAGVFRGIDGANELTNLIAALGLPDYLKPGHEHCFHRRSRDLSPVMWTVGLLLRTHGGRGWDYSRIWATILDRNGASWTNGHSEWGLRYALWGPRHDDWPYDDSDHRDGRFTVVYQPPGKNEPWSSVALRNDGWAYTNGEPTDVGARWRAGESIVDLATELTERARFAELRTT